MDFRDRSVSSERSRSELRGFRTGFGVYGLSRGGGINEANFRGRGGGINEANFRGRGGGINEANFRGRGGGINEANFRGRGGGINEANFRGRRGGSSSGRRGGSESNFRERGRSESNFRGGIGGSRGNRDGSYSTNKYPSDTLNRSRSQESFQRMYPIGVKVMESLLEREPYIISLELLKNNSGYEILLNESEIKDFKLCLVIKLLSRCVGSRANSDGALELLLLSFKSTNFCQNIMKFISEIKFDTSKAPEYLSLIGNIIEQFIRLTPMAAFYTASNLTDVCVGAIHHLKSEERVSVDSLEQLFENIKLLIKESRAKVQRSQRSKSLQTEDPPDNFRHHEVIPTAAEIQSIGRPFLRPFIIEGSYENSNHYLDVQFRLLKEDFIRPLREGLCRYLGNDSRSSDIRVYSDVKVYSTDVERTVQVYYLKLNLRNIFRIENSKRLMYGNLLCISADNFETMMVASVNSRDKLDKKLLGIKLEIEPFTLDLDATYLVVESKAYFVSYKHTLKALQLIDRVPLEDYIVYVNESETAPNYLERLTTYEFPSRGITRTGLTRRSFDFDSSGSDDDMKLSTASEVRLLDDIRYWPSFAELNFDESQRRAFHGALTRQMAIIQGPPGTGKTFLGLQITKILLHNKVKWDKNTQHPILVVCYTNHALDQFLVGIKSFTDDIIRVGSRSKNEDLKNYQINNRILTYRRNDDDCVVSKRYHQVHMELKELKSNLDPIPKILDFLNEPGIIDYPTFTQNYLNVIPPHLRNQLGAMTMRNFLVESFIELEEGCVNGVMDKENHFQSHGPKEEGDVIDEPLAAVDEEIRREEEYERMLDEDEDEDDYHSHELAKSLHVLGIKHFYYKFECVPSEIEIQMYTMHNEIESNPFSKDTRAFHHEIQKLSLQLRAMRAGQVIRGNDDECKELESVYNIQELDFIHRWKLYNYWKMKLREGYKRIKLQLELKYRELSKTMLSLKDLKYLNLMRKVDIVGMTTTGAAQYCKLLHDLAPPIVIIEEAAEIMEAHVLSSLSSKCEHLILIGDHRQLRPKPNVYELGLKFHLDVSLFERMIKNKIQYQILEYQHRMKTLFSNLLVPTIYEDLKDHISVYSYPKIKGVEKDLFFLDHKKLENAPLDDNESVENLYEAEFLMGLCRHLILQGYVADEINIITPYSGQHRCLKKLQKKSDFRLCDDVRIGILDNFQGEECDIILLSLVRSNKEEKVGFVKTDNRVCVALSRAKHGMYIIGNMSLLAKSSLLWTEINRKLVDGDHIGPHLQLVCQNHPDELIKVDSYEDMLLKSPEGGCKRQCSGNLPACGHRCPQLCHVFDSDHKSVKCTLPCPKTLCEQYHQCPKLCSEKCSPCEVPMKKQLPCSHEHTVACSVEPKDFACPTKVNKELPSCKHVFPLPCHVDLLTYKCTKHCTTRLDCGHQCKNKCHVTSDPDHEDYDCYEACEMFSENCVFNHRCKKKCFEDCGRCTVKIARNMTCGHTINNIACGIPESEITCPYPCKKDLLCSHPCPKKCGEKCGGCKIMVDKMRPECKHTVKAPCGCDNVYGLSSIFCNEKCVKTLLCGHLCKEKCSEICTSKCQEAVPSGLKCPRGHSMKLPCHVNKSITTLTNTEGKSVGEYCTEVCGTMLDCKHNCKGKCGVCFNGRLHVSCGENCKKALVCGHVCKAPCSGACPPCQEPCLWKCTHSKCTKRCGVPCTNCMQECTRRCVHSSCSVKCGKKCDRKPCTEPCPKVLKCKHSCIGFCGEPCPPLCKICDKETVTEIFFGSEDEEDARFVLLEDCQHTFEANGLDSWMKVSATAEDGRVEIGMKKCPSCSVAIYNTKRYQSLILDSFENVLKVKNKHYSSKVKFQKNNFKAVLKELRNEWREEVDQLRGDLGFDINFFPLRKQKPISDRQFALYAFQVEFLKAARTIRAKIVDSPISSSPFVSTSRTYLKLVKKLVALVMKQRLSISSQMMEELSCEFRRLEVNASVEKVRSHIGRENTRTIIDKIDTLMDPTIKFDKELERKVVAYLKEAEKIIGSLGITNSERLAIVKAMGLSQGHWYACPNGHVYCIADCGGAVMESKCPDCKATIGGGSHRLRGDNRVATEMDGATRSAWPGGL